MLFRHDKTVAQSNTKSCLERTKVVTNANCPSTPRTTRRPGLTQVVHNNFHKSGNLKINYFLGRMIIEREK